MKVSIVIDGQEYYHTRKIINWYIDWGKLFEFYKNAFGDIHKAYYCSGGIAPHANEKEARKQWKRIEKGGFKIPDKDNKWKPRNSDQKERTNIDATVGWYLQKCFDESDAIILFAGDGDYYTPLNKYLKAGKHVICVTHSERISSNLVGLVQSIDIENLKQYIIKEPIKNNDKDEEQENN